MRDHLSRQVNYLRLSITDRCNLRCRYCMPADGVVSRSCAEMLSFEDMLRIARVAATLGIGKVRVTGGEPLVRKGVLDFLHRLHQIPGIDEVCLTSNGVLLHDFATALGDVGIERINLSLDSLKPERFADITRGGELNRVLRGIEAAEAAGMRIKLNMVVMRGVNDDEILDFARMSIDNAWSIRFIEYMPTNQDPDWHQKSISGAEILTRLRNHFLIEEAQRGSHCGPARPYRIQGAKGSLGIITPMSDHFCSSCNRVRVTADGHARSCLLADHQVDLRTALKVIDDTPLRMLLEGVICSKGSHHHLGATTEAPSPFSMNRIGG